MLYQKREFQKEKKMEKKMLEWSELKEKECQRFVVYIKCNTTLNRWYMHLVLPQPREHKNKTI